MVGVGLRVGSVDAVTKISTFRSFLNINTV